MIRVLLIHDTMLIRSALAALLGGEQDFDVLATAWQHAHGPAADWPAQVCVVDGDGAWSGLPGTAAERMVILTEAGRPGLLRRASQADVRGFVSKDSAPERMIAAVRRVATGERYVDDALACDFLRAADMPLTSRELAVLAAAAEGAPVAEIAAALHLAGGTVRNYLAAVIRKTGARNRVDAIRIAGSAGWL
ncbi:LuxR C-terminal-related transcriptional regulator [Streptomyces sp. MAR4 CNX-425]|uniref:LuxR C-terminal-related transcriptional regulator n=1 Tax=Streptomyces sp. MAR4 CNX-425 TaxID=3406343 RepID=UPI003B500660